MKQLQVLSVILVISALIGGLGGCRSNPMKDVPKELDARVRTFEDVVRWRPLQKMYGFLKVEPGTQIEIQEGLENVRVTGYDIVEPLNPIDPMRWRQAAEIRYVLTDRQVVRQLVDFQIWESEGEGEGWVRTTPVPIFK
jgi:hypothetical protein